MKGETITPKFLTQELVKSAVDMVLDAVINHPPSGRQFLKRGGCHIVVLVPAMQDDVSEANNWPDYPLHPVAIYQDSRGKDIWTKNYEEIAKCKALQAWHGRNHGHTDIRPHLLFSGDAPYVGAVNRHGIVVACSGFDSWHDIMVAGMIADVIVGFAYDAWMKSDDRRLEWTFIA